MTSSIPDLVVLLPGITGSELMKGNQVVWGWSGGVLVRNLLTQGAHLRNTLRIENDSPTAATLDDGIRPSGLMRDMHLFPGLWKIDGYDGIEQHLETTFGLKPGQNFFPFAYDWRRDNRAAAHRLCREAHTWLENWREQSGNPNARLVLIAHSMGGLVARYYLEVLQGWRNTRALITFGTPYSGSLNAVRSLVTGLGRFGIELTTLARQLPSLYQLLPIHRCCDTGADELDFLSSLRLDGIDRCLLDDACRFHNEIAEANASNERELAYWQDGYGIYPIVGVDQRTLQSVRVRDNQISILSTLKNTDLGGDGTVPRISAVPVTKKLTSAVFASTRHASLHQDRAMLSHVSGLISSFYVEDIKLRGSVGKYRSGTVHISLEVEDFYWAAEPIVIRARPSDPAQKLRATVKDKCGRSVDGVDLKPDADGWHRAELARLGEGVYRLVVAGQQEVVQQARDVFEVVAGSA